MSEKTSRRKIYLKKQKQIAETNLSAHQDEEFQKFGMRGIVFVLFLGFFPTCICWRTDKSNVHNPSRDVATPTISKYAAKMLFLTHIEPIHIRRQVHCMKNTQTP